ncbi:barstar family protein [Amycolatopsis sp. NPDC005232]|uniref:barstar family protein n=1 Tax=Amycolatopsis sp. NPDC005232 TaxID=3157027 RepID=UPI0033B06E6E
MAAFDPSAKLSTEPDFLLLQDSGVTLFWSTAVLATTTTWLTDHGYRIVEIDTAGWTREADLHRDVASALDFPEYYDDNLDGLDDWMGDIASGDHAPDLAAGGFVLVLRHYDKFAAVQRHLAHAVLDIFARQARSALLFGHRMMCLVQSDDPGLSFPAVGARPVEWNDAEEPDSLRGV